MLELAWAIYFEATFAVWLEEHQFRPEFRHLERFFFLDMTIDDLGIPPAPGYYDDVRPWARMRWTP